MKKTKKPTNQTQEVLYYLLTRIKIDRKQMMLSCDVLNLAEQISRLRNQHFVKINLSEFKTFNKFGRVVKVGEYSLDNKKEASEIYKLMQSDNIKL